MKQDEAILLQCKRDGLTPAKLLSLQSKYRQTPDVRDYLTNTLHTLLCDRYGISYHSPKQKLIDLVVKELDI